MSVSREDILAAIKGDTEALAGRGVKTNLDVPIQRSSLLDAFAQQIGAPPGGSSLLDAFRERFPAQPVTPLLPPSAFQNLGGDSEEGGLLGLPVIGDVLDVLDTPRAAIVSGIKEIGDAISGGDASFSDWYKQTSSNMSMSEVLRDWNVDLPGPLDFVAGMGLDIALDPLTYLFGIGVIARVAKADKIVEGLMAASRAAERAGDAAQAGRYIAAADVARTSGTLAAAARYGDEFAQLGMRPGIGFTIPGFGRLSRNVVERPLGTVAPKLKDWAAARRARQVPDFIIDDALDATEAVARAEGVQTAVRNMPQFREQLIQTMRGTSVATDQATQQALNRIATMANRMPIEGVRIGGAKVAGLLGSIPQNAFTKAVRSSWVVNKVGQEGSGWLNKFNSRAAIIARKRGDDVAEAATARLMDRAGLRSINVAAAWERRSLEEFAQIAEGARAAGLTEADLSDLIFRLASTPDEAFATLDNIPQWAKAADGGPSDLVLRVKQWWREMGTRANESTPGLGLQLLEENYAARMWDDLSQKGYNSQQGVPLGGETQLAGDPFKGRRLLEPQQIRERMGGIIGKIQRGERLQAWEAAYRDDAARIIRAAQSEKKDVLDILDAELADGVRYGNDKTQVMTNRYGDGVIADPSATTPSVLEQMADIRKAMGEPDDLFKFSDDVEKVVSRYIGMMRSRIRTQSVLDQAVQAGILAPGSQLVSRGELIKQIDAVLVALERSYKDTKNAVGDLAETLRKVRGEEPVDTAEIRNLLAEILSSTGMTEAQILSSLDGPVGEILEEVTRLSVLSDDVNQIIDAAVAGKFAYDDLSEGAKEILEGRGWSRIDAEGNPVLTKQGERKVVAAVRNRDKALEEYEEAVSFLSEIVLLNSKVEEQVKLVSRVLNTIQQPTVNPVSGNPEVGARTIESLRKSLKDSGDRLADGRRELATLAQRVRRSMESDPTVVVAKLLQNMGEINDVTRKVVRSSDSGSLRTFTRNFEALKDMPPGGIIEIVETLPGGRAVGANAVNWRVRVKSFPAGRKVTDVPGSGKTLATILGQENADSFETVATILAGLPKAQRAASKSLLESMANLMALQRMYGDLVADPRHIDAVVDAVVERRLTPELFRSMEIEPERVLREMIEGADMGSARTKAGKEIGAIRQQKAEYDAFRDELLSDLERFYNRLTENQNIQRELVGNLDEVEEAALAIETQSRLAMLRAERDRLIDTAFAGDLYKTVEDAGQAAKIVADSQRNFGLFNDAYSGNLQQLVERMLRPYAGEGAFSPNVSQLTQRKLRPYSFIAPLGDGSMTAAQADEMARSFSEMFEAAARTMDYKELSGFLRSVSKFSNWWKAQAVGTPGFVLRNIMGAAWINNQVAGVPLSTMGRVRLIRNMAAKRGAALRKELAEAGTLMANNPNMPDIARGLDAMIAEGGVKLRGRGGAPSVFSGPSRVAADELRIFKEWWESGVAGGTGGRGIDLITDLDRPGVLTEGQGLRSGFRSGTWKPLGRGSSDFKGFTAIRGWNADAEFAARGALAHHMMTQGSSLDDALGDVIKYHFDYSDLTPQERMLRNVIPFWTWQRRIMPVLIESIGRRPTAWSRITQFKSNLEAASPMEGVVPDYYAENAAMRLPFSVNGVRSYLMPGLPFNDLLRFSKAFESTPDGAPRDGLETVTELGRPLLESSLPVYKLPIELMMGKKTFTQAPLTGEYEPLPQWGNLPGVREILGTVPLLNVERNSRGQWMITDRSAYTIESLIPVFARLSRVKPQDDDYAWSESKSLKSLGTTISLLTGLGLRFNTPLEKHNAQISQMFDQRAQRSVARSLEGF